MFFLVCGSIGVWLIVFLVILVNFGFIVVGIIMIGLFIVLFLIGVIWVLKICGRLFDDIMKECYGNIID